MLSNSSKSLITANGFLRSHTAVTISSNAADNLISDERPKRLCVIFQIVLSIELEQATAR